MKKPGGIIRQLRLALHPRQLALLALLAFPSHGKADEPSAPLPSQAQVAIDRTTRGFSKARFCKPHKLDPGQTAHEFAPLIVEEVKDVPGDSTPGMGFSDSASKRAVFEPSTVYFDTGKVRANDETLEQIVFLWAYEQKEIKPSSSDKPPILVRGVRVILGSDGMPVLWEALVGPENARVFYVSKSVEDAARKQFGDPLEARHVSIERKHLDALNLVVARVIDDGPVPMGPYVYVEALRDRIITTVHCRCSPSQFDEAAQTVEYQLLPIENLDADWLREKAGIRVEKLLQCEPLDTIFRWPKLSP